MRFWIVTCAAAAIIAPPVAAKDRHWVPVRDRKAVFESVILRGERSGKLRDWEVRRARSLYGDIARRELRYEASPPGLTLTEKGNLDFRFNGMIDALKAQIAK